MIEVPEFVNTRSLKKKFNRYRIESYSEASKDSPDDLKITKVIMESGDMFFADMPFSEFEKLLEVKI